MGTRADFYLGRGTEATWLGSIAWDGHAENFYDLIEITTAEGFQERVSKMLRERDDGTRPGDGWPWPWNDSHITDYSYAFDDGAAWVTDNREDGAICPVCNHSIYKEWVRFADVRDAGERRTKAHNAWRAACAKLREPYDEAVDKFHAGMGPDPGKAPTPPEEPDLDAPEYQAPGHGKAMFPDMRSRKNVTLGERSGISLFTVGK